MFSLSAMDEGINVCVAFYLRMYLYMCMRAFFACMYVYVCVFFVRLCMCISLFVNVF